MQAKTFGTGASFFISLGAGALTQSPDYQFLALPVAIVSGTLFLVLVIMFLVSNWRDIKSWLAKVESWHVIAVGVLIVVAGLIWQFVRTPASNEKISLLEKQLEESQKALAAAQANPTDQAERGGFIVPSTRKSTEAGRPKYTTYEKEQRLRAIDEIYDVIAGRLQPIYTEGRKLIYEDVYRGPVPDAEQRLKDYTAKVQSAFDALNALLKKYNYYPDIVGATTKNTFNDVAATHGARNLVPELQALRAKAPNDIQWFLLRNTTMADAINQINAFDRYLKETLSLLQALRVETEKAEIYPPPPQSTTGGNKRTESSGQIQQAAKIELTLLKPPFRYDFKWMAPSNLQIVTDIGFVPAGLIRPDTRIPVFYVKNLSKEFARNIRVTWTINELEQLIKPITSPHLLRYGARVVRDNGGGSLRLVTRNSQIEESSSYFYREMQTHSIEFIDPAAQHEICPDRVYAGVEILLLEKMAGALLNQQARASMGCQIEGDGFSPLLFNVIVTATSHRAQMATNGILQNKGDDAKASLTFNVQRI